MNSNLQPPALRVYLVEDHVPIRERLAALVETVEGAEVVGMADTPDAAFAGIGGARPDLVVVDLQLKSGTSGLAVLKWLREHSPGTPSVVLSNVVFPQMKQACLDLGAWQVLDKSREALRFRDVIRDIAESRIHA